MSTSIAHSSVSLNTNWMFKKGDLSSPETYLPANDLPTEIHLDLLKNEQIADPFKDLNELSVRWIADETWTYRTTFPSPSNHGKPGLVTILKFEGLDTFASVYLNRKLVLETDNMFIAYQLDVTGRLHADRDNELEIVFSSAHKRGLELIEKHKEHKFIVHQTEVSRGPVRKAQYHWGWDWGPILLTSGPWKPIVLETYSAKIDKLWVEYDLSEDLKRAKGKVFAEVSHPHGQIAFSIARPNDQSNADYLLKDLQLNANTWEGSFDIPVSLWWPRGYGEQNLYNITAALFSSEQADASVQIHDEKMTIGFRKTELIQEDDEVGTSFYFRINSVDIFAGGSCWIPADSFVSRIKPNQYRDWVRLAAEGNQTMIRVWGGGIYEDSSFYEACDEFGVLVWQDFMFACANYPAYPEYLISVETEARQNVQRLRRHPSIVIWAGNNEDYQIVERYGLEYRFDEDKDPQSWLKTDFPARYIYEYLLPKIVKEESKNVPYHPSSPWGNGKSTTLKVDSSVGDIHQWNVWHGEMKPYQHLPHMGGRFVSEFGMEAYPHLETIERSVTEESDRYPGSMAMDFRNKAIGHERRLISYVAENFRIKYDLASFTHLTQVMQADAMTWAYKSWRRQWGSNGQRGCGGVLVWQLNDCWPTMSWAVVDYYLIPKPAYYAIKRALEPVVVSVTRKFQDWTMRPADDLWKRDTSHINMRRVWEDVEFDVWAASSKNEDINAKLVVKYISIRTGDEVMAGLTKDFTIKPNGTTEVVQSQKAVVEKDDDKPFKPSRADPFVIFVSLQIDGEEAASDISWPDPIKYLQFEDRGIQVEYRNKDKMLAIVSAKKPVKGFVFEEKEGVKLSDNGFDLMPGQVKKVAIIGTPTDQLTWKFVGE
ncbi:glycoside hydrolase superfamily [Dendryphion nanum]|uniref:Beta-mannosidase B n=1 Tax=Dendryphion nanum TaxID=256645 RepID=A0A9P9DXD4_9PLEO|nr:glycoside hydrolase superfamily [Dendryphion nanum]